MRATKGFLPFISLAMLLAGCNGDGATTTESGPAAADLGTCTQPAFPTQLHVKCSVISALNPNAVLQGVEAIFDVQNAVFSGQSQYNLPPKKSGDLSGDVSLRLSAGESATEKFVGNFTDTKFLAHGEGMNLTLSSISGEALSMGIELYYAQPASVKWKGVSYSMSCATDYVYPTAAASEVPCETSYPSQATVTCTNPSPASPTDIATLQGELALKFETVNYYGQGQTRWDLDGHASGKITAATLAGVKSQSDFSSGGLSAMAAADHTAAFSFGGSLDGVAGGVALKAADASGSVATEVIYKGQKLNMNCVLHF